MTHFLGFSFKVCPFVFLILSLFTSSVIAQNTSIVTGLRLKNVPVSSVKLQVMPPGKGGNLVELSLDDKIASGTTMIIPPETVVVLKSPGGTQVLKSIHSGKSMEYKVEINEQGENHVIKGLGAQIANIVKKTLGYNYRNTNERGTTAASKGTEFTFTDLTDNEIEKAQIITSEGTIKILDEVPCYVKGVPIINDNSGKKVTKSISQTQSAGDELFTSSNEPINYESLEDAISYILDQIEKERADGNIDPEVLADDLVSLGDMFMEMKEPGKAIEPYLTAVNTYKVAYGKEDAYTIEAQLLLADAYQKSGRKAEADFLLQSVIKILRRDLEESEEDLRFLREDDDDDEESIDMFCDRVGELYFQMGWAYAIAGNKILSTQYYTRAREECN